MSKKKKYKIQPDPIKKDNSCPMHPDSCLFKAMGLVCICIIGLDIFCYDVPGAMEVILWYHNKLIIHSFKQNKYMKTG